MSTSTIYFAKADGVITTESVFPNSWGFGAFVFNTLSKRYDCQTKYITLDPQKERAFGPLVDWLRLWEWINEFSPKIPAFEMNTLVAGYDGAFVQGKEDILRLAESFERFDEHYSKSDGPFSHLTKMALALRGAVDRGFEYVCFYPMSVSPDHWVVYDGPDESHVFCFTNPDDAEKVSHTRYHMAPVDGPDVSLSDLLRRNRE
jgi:hypothetical protein